MAKLNFLSLLIPFSILFISGAAASNPTDFIKSSCRATRYPDVCINCLSGYANAIQQSEHRLARTALSVSLARAQSAATFISKLTAVRGMKPRERQAVMDCLENLADGVDRLGQSVKELGAMNGPMGVQDFMWHMSNVQTWVSTALTDENTCFDGFAGRGMDGGVKSVVRRRVLGVAQVTSNALALVNRFASRHKAGAETENKP